MSYVCSRVLNIGINHGVTLESGCSIRLTNPDLRMGASIMSLRLHLPKSPRVSFSSTCRDASRVTRSIVLQGFDVADAGARTLMLHSNRATAPSWSLDLQALHARCYVYPSPIIGLAEVN